MTKYLVFGPGERKNIFIIELHITWIPFTVLSRMMNEQSTQIALNCDL